LATGGSVLASALNLLGEAAPLPFRSASTSRWGGGWYRSDLRRPPRCGHRLRGSPGAREVLNRFVEIETDADQVDA
jgi:hypothetical protein